MKTEYCQLKLGMNDKRAQFPDRNRSCDKNAYWVCKRCMDMYAQSLASPLLTGIRK